MPIYFDNAATTPINPEVVALMTETLQHHYGNPSSIHALGLASRTLIEKARKSIAKVLNCTPGEIFFTSGGTEADNMALIAAVDNLGVKNIISSPLEHHAVLHTLAYLQDIRGVRVHFVDVLPNGHINLKHLETLLSNHTNTLVSLMHGNNEIGNMIDLYQVGNMVKAHKGYFHTDTVQTIGYFPFDLANMPIDFLAGSAHKFNGPKGVGFIYIKGGVKLSPFIHGGAQERNMRGGTENLAGIVGMAKALEIAYAQLDEKREHIYFLKHYMLKALVSNFPDIQFNGDPEGNSLYTVLNVSFPPSEKGEMLLFNLDIEGIACSGGSACSSGAQQGSHVLKAINHNPKRAAVRFSFGKQNTLAEIDTTINKLLHILQPVNAL